MNRLIIHKYITLFLFLLLIPTLAFSEDSNKLIGEWETEPILSQLGRIVINYSFKDNKSFTGIVTFIDAELPNEPITGEYVIKDNNLILKLDDERTVSSIFYFEKELLVIDENGNDIFRFSRKQ